MAWTAAVPRMHIVREWNPTAHEEFWTGTCELLNNKDIATFRGCAKWAERVAQRELHERLQAAEVEARIMVRMLYGMEELRNFVDNGGMRAAVSRR